MLSIIVSETFLPLLAAFRPCFTAPSHRTFCVLVAGWIRCMGRHTVTGVVVAADAVAGRHISVFQRFVARARWSLDPIGRVVFTLALRWIPADWPLYVLVDATLARKGGKGISLATMHHDPLLSSARKPFCSFGHVWVVLALWVPLPLGGSRGFTLPLLFRLYGGAKRGGKTDAPSRPRPGTRQRAAEAAHADHPRRTKLELALEMIALIARWVGERPVYVVVDSAYAGRTLLEGRPANVHVLSRLRRDAALWARPGRRRPGQQGRPRRRGGACPPSRRWPRPAAAGTRCRSPSMAAE